MLLDYALGDKVVGNVPEEAFRNADEQFTKEFFSYLGSKAFEFDHGSTPEFKQDYEYNVGDVVLYKSDLYVCTEHVLPQQDEVPGIGSKYWQLLGNPQVLVEDFTDENTDKEVVLDFSEYSSFFFKIKKNLRVRIPASEAMRKDGCYDLYISHGSNVNITFNAKFENKFIVSNKPSVEHVKIFVKGSKTYLIQEMNSLGNILGDLVAYLESAGYAKKTDVHKIIKGA